MGVKGSNISRIRAIVVNFAKSKLTLSPFATHITLHVLCDVTF
jgi:hypothetical protein